MGLLRQALVGEPECETVSEPRRVRQVLGRIRLWTSGEQREDADHTTVDPNRNLQAGLQAALRSRHDIEHLRLDPVDHRRGPISRDSLRRAIGRPRDTGTKPRPRPGGRAAPRHAGQPGE